MFPPTCRTELFELIAIRVKPKKTRHSIGTLVIRTVIVV